MTFVILAILLGFIPASVARSKGREFGAWWLYGSALFIVALPHALLMAPDRARVEARVSEEEGRRKCPSCAELVKIEATICRFCQRPLPPITRGVAASVHDDRYDPSRQSLEWKILMAMGLLVGVVVLGLVIVSAVMRIR